ncbi:MAG: class I SAM-dependent methyltransferase, partial [Trichodesmium sp. St17_bin3_1_1]|nr:class I SAM-dependent methyltransferase [Trichodesmium sp. St17_bin3_1_1]
FQKWYLDTVVVPVARNLGLTKEYAYISPSLTKFPTGKEQTALAYKAGFVNAKHYPMIGGMMGILVITK